MKETDLDEVMDQWKDVEMVIWLVYCWVHGLEERMVSM